MEIFWILFLIVSLISGSTSGQEWNIQDLEGRADLDNLVKYIYNSNNGTWDPANLNLTELQDSIHDKLALLNLTSSEISLNSFLDFNGVAITPLGQLTAWVGHLISPLVMYAVVFGGAFILMQIIFQVKKKKLSGSFKFRGT